MHNRSRLLLGFLLFALMLAYWGMTGYLKFWFHGSYDGWVSRAEDGQRFIILKVDPQGPSNILQVGDEILAINGASPRLDPRRSLNLSRALPPDSPYRMTIQRGDAVLELLLKTAASPPADRPTFDFWDVLKWLGSVIFLLVGYGVLALKPDSKQVWILALMLMAFVGTSYDASAPYHYFGSAGDYLATLARVFSLCLLPLFLHFFLIFPERSSWLNRFPRFETWLYLPLLVVEFFFAPERIPYRWMRHFYQWVHWDWLFRHRVQWLGLLIVFAYLVAGLLCLWLGYRVAHTDAKRRLRVIAVGAGLGFLNLLLVVVIESTGLYQDFKAVHDFLQMSFVVTLPLIPLSFAYAIIRHKIIPISLIIRRGVRYVLVSRGAIVIESLIAVGLVWLFVKFFFPHWQFLTVIGSAAFAILAWRLEDRLHRRYVAPAIDRRFFRQSYDAQRIIGELSDSLRTTTDIPRLLELVAVKLQAALQTESVTILLKDPQDGNFKSAYACEYDVRSGGALNCQRSLELPANSHTLNVLAQTDEPLELDWPVQPDPEPAGMNNSHSYDSFLKHELQVLQTLRPALLLPLKVKDELSGAVFLGARLGDLPFSSEDKRLVQSVVAPTSLALENASLMEQRIEDARRREELEAENEARARELEEARQLQLSMLPKSVPQLPHLEIATYMKTATEVGGDYYDFHLSSDGILTIAVGDATGHGLKAGTVVTAMKSLFHTHAPNRELLPVLSQSSHALKAMNLRSLFMALTLVKLKGHELRIASAGMPPALVFHAAVNTVEEIQMNTMPLGSLRNYPYREQGVFLQTGDVVVLMSDGFPERFNAVGEILGFDKAQQVLRDTAHKSAQQIVEQFIQTAESWADGFAQNDDVTFVVLKVK